MLKLKTAIDMLGKKVLYLKTPSSKDEVFKVSRKCVEKYYDSANTIVKSIEPLIKRGTEYMLITVDKIRIKI